MVCLIVSCRTAFPCSWAHSLMIRSSHLDIVFTGNVSFWQRSVTLHNNNRKPTCILSHLDRQFACIRVGLFDDHDIISVEITIHGLQFERITRHSEYIIHESRLYSMSFPDSRSVFWSIHGSRETPSRPWWVSVCTKITEKVKNDLKIPPQHLFHYFFQLPRAFPI